MNTFSVLIRRARKNDYGKMLNIINNQTDNNDSVLLKNTKQLRRYNYFVAICEEKVVGTIGFKYWKNHPPEIISLVVNPEFRGKHIGTRLVEHCMSEILNIRNRMFVLTTTPSLFEKLGFKKTDIKKYPHKIYADCRLCRRNAGSPFDPLCNEVALEFSF